jgi:hypothetical protein
MDRQFRYGLDLMLTGLGLRRSQPGPDQDADRLTAARD